MQIFVEVSSLSFISSYLSYYSSEPNNKFRNIYFLIWLEVQARRSCHPNKQGLLINLVNDLWCSLVASFISFALCGLACCCRRSLSFIRCVSSFSSNLPYGDSRSIMVVAYGMCQYCKKTYTSDNNDFRRCWVIAAEKSHIIIYRIS